MPSLGWRSLRIAPLERYGLDAGPVELRLDVRERPVEDDRPAHRRAYRFRGALVLEAGGLERHRRGRAQHVFGGERVHRVQVHRGDAVPVGRLAVRGAPDEVAQIQGCLGDCGFGCCGLAFGAALGGGLWWVVYRIAYWWWFLVWGWVVDWLGGELCGMCYLSKGHFS